MRSAVLVAAACLILTFGSLGAPIKFDTIKVGSRVYQNVTVLSLNATDVYFSHSGGMANAKLRLLAPEVQKVLGYNPKLAAKVEIQRETGNQLYQSNVLSHLADAGGGSPSSASSTRSSEKNLSDAISSKSLLGKPGPALDYKLWTQLGGNVPTGKYVLLAFSASWSIPSAHSLGGLAALQKKFPDDLQMLVLSEDSDATADQAANPSPEELPTAPDENGTLAAAAGATSVPFVLLMDPSGTVLYQGHPAALSESSLANVLSKSR